VYVLRGNVVMRANASPPSVPIKSGGLDQHCSLIRHIVISQRAKSQVKHGPWTASRGSRIGGLTVSLFIHIRFCSTHSNTLERGSSGLKVFVNVEPFVRRAYGGGWQYETRAGDPGDDYSKWPNNLGRFYLDAAFRIFFLCG
jgi:hypothetical protein